MMEETEYRDNERVLYKTQCKPILPNKEPGEVDCFVTEGHIAVETGKPITIALSCIRECSEPLSGTVELTFLDDSGKKHKLELEMAAKELHHFRRAVYGQIVGRFIHEASERRSNTTLEKFFSTTKEIFRDKTRDNICAGLQVLGVDAILGERGQLEEEVRIFVSAEDIRSRSLGIIHVSGSPIRWINVCRTRTSGAQSGSTYYYTEYGVPDARLGPDFPGVWIKTVRVKAVPLVGKVVDLRWEGQDSDLGIIGHLNSNDQLKQPIMESCHVTITDVSECGCWMMSTQTHLVPSRELWDCYEAIAEHLLAHW